MTAGTSKNHPLFVETVEGNLSAGMRQLSGVNTQWHNRATVGSVAQHWPGVLMPKSN